MQSRFRFENVWLEDLGCATTVECSFLYHHNSNIYDKIVKCTAELQRWGERKVKNLHHQLNEAKLQMEAYMGRQDNMGATTFEKYKHKYFALLKNHDIYWRQRAKIFWLREGDINSKYFHAIASGKRKKNKIERLQDDIGVWREKHSGLGRLITNHFRTIFS